MAVSAPGYETVTTNVQVGMSQTVPAPQVSLQPLGLISGLITTKEGSPTAPDCVVLVPSGASMPSACVITAATLAGPDSPAAGPSCVAGTDPQTRCAVTVEGSFEIRGVTSGGYDQAVLPQDPEYLAPTKLPLLLDRGAAVRYEPVLNRKPRVKITVLAPDDFTGALSPVPGISVPLIDEAGAARGVPLGTTVTGADGSLMLTQLTDGIYTASATQSRPAPDRSLRGTGSTDTVTSNQTGSATVVLTGKVGPVGGRLLIRVDDEIIRRPVADAQVTVSGIVGYAGTAAQAGSADLRTNGDGCFAIFPAGWTAPVTLPGCATPISVPGSTMSAGATMTTGVNNLPATLLTRSVAVKVAALPGKTKPFSATQVVVPLPAQVSANPAIYSENWLLETILLGAEPSAFGSHQFTFAGMSVNGAAARTAVSVVRKPAGAGNVSVGVNGNTLQFKDDSILNSNLAVPGQYTLQVSSLGYGTKQLFLWCDLGQECIFSRSAADHTAADDALTLQPLGRIDGTITIAGQTDPVTVVKNASVRVLSAPSGVGAVTVTANLPPVQADSSLTANINFSDAQFDPLGTSAIGLAVPGTYVFEVAVSGFRTTQVIVNCEVPGSGGPGAATSTCDPVAAALVMLPKGTGTVSTDVSTFVPAVGQGSADDSTLTAVQVSIVSKPAVAGAVSATVTADGAMHWQDSAIVPKGLLQVGSYVFRLSLPGYQSRTATMTCSATACAIPVGALKLYRNGIISGGIVVQLGTPSAADLNGAQVRVVKTPSGTGAVTVAVIAQPQAVDDAARAANSQVTRAITFKDENYASLATGLALPGEYIFEVSVNGFTPVTVKLVCSAMSSAANSCISSTGDPALAAFQAKIIQFPTGTGKVVLAPVASAGAVLTDTQISITAKASAASVITANVSASGVIEWQDSTLPAGLLVAGTYAFTVSLKGFRTVAATMVCAAGQSCVVTPVVSLGDVNPLTLHLFGTIFGDVTVPAGSISDADFSAGSVRVVSAPNGVGSVTVAIASTTSATGTGTVSRAITFSDNSFAGLTTGLALPGFYIFEVSLPGFSPNQVSVNCSLPTTDANACKSTSGVPTGKPFQALPVRFPLGAGEVYFSSEVGTNYRDVQISISSQASSTSTINATVSPVTIGGITHGKIVWKDSSLPDGLLVAGSYAFRLSARGYQSISATMQCASGADCIVTASPVDSVPNRITLQRLGTITGQFSVVGASDSDPVSPADQGTVAALNNARIRVISTPSGVGAVSVASETAGTNKSSRKITFSDSTFASLSTPGLALPGNYVFEVSAAGFTPVTVSITCNVSMGSQGECVSANGAVSGPFQAALVQAPLGAGVVTLEGPGVVTVDKSNVQLTVTAKAAGASVVTASVDGSGQVKWKDSELPDGLLAPGSYGFRVTLPGFQGITATMLCASGSGCTISAAPNGVPDLVLHRYAAITGSISLAPITPALPDLPGGAPDTRGGATEAELNQAQIRVVEAPSNAGPITASVAKRILPPGDPDPRNLAPAPRPITFTDANLSDVGYAGMAVPGDYRFEVTIPGYLPTVVKVRCSAAPGAVSSCTSISVSDGNGQPGAAFQAALTRLPAATGSIRLSPAPADAATLVVQAQITISQKASATSVIDATVAANGTIVFKDSALPDGLLLAGNYVIAVTLPGYQSSAASYPFTCAGPLCTLGEIAMLKLARPTVTVLPDQVPTSAISWSQAVVTVTDRPSVAANVRISVVAASGDPNEGVLEWAVPLLAAGDVPAGRFEVSVTLPGYIPSDKYWLDCGLGIGCQLFAAQLPLAPAPSIELHRYPQLSGLAWQLAENPVDGNGYPNPAGVGFAIPTAEITGAPTGSAGVTVTGVVPTGAANGTFVWQENGVPSGLVRAGAYTITLSSPGYERQSFAFTCSTTACPTTPTVLRLTRPGDVAVSIVDSTSAPVGGATLTLSGSAITSNTSTLNQSVNDLTFPGLSARLPDSYSLRVQAAGYRFETFDSTSAAVTCQPTSGSGAPGFKVYSGGTVCVVTVAKLGQLSGVVRGITPSISGGAETTELLADVALTARSLNADGTEAASPKTFVVRSAADGGFTLSGSNQIEGLANAGSRYRLTATKSGYTDVSVDVAYNAVGVLSVVGSSPSLTITAGALALRMLVNQVQLRVLFKLDTSDVLGGINVSLLSGPTVVASCFSNPKVNCAPPVASSPLIPASGSDPEVPAVVGTNYFAFTGLYPGVYTLKIDPVVVGDPTYRSLTTQVIVYPGQAVQSTQVSLATGTTVVSGLVKIPDGTAGTSPAENQRVFLVPEANPAVTAASLHADTDSSGAFVITAVPDGRYIAVITREGYAPWSSAGFGAAAAVNPNVTISPVTLTRITRKVVITVQSLADTSAVLTGTQVELRNTAPLATGAASEAALAPTTLVSGNTATFENVPTGTWTAKVVTLPGARVFSSGLFSVSIPVSGTGVLTDPVTAQVDVRDSAKVLIATWILDGCVTSPTGLSADLTVTSAPGPGVPNTPAGGYQMALGAPILVGSTYTAKSATVYLPDASYAAVIAPNGANWTTTVSSTFTSSTADVSPDTPVMDIAATKVAVPVSVTLDGLAAQSLQVQASAPGEPAEGPVTVTNGVGLLCLKPSVGWNIAVSNAGTPGISYVSSAATDVIPVAGGTAAYSYNAFSLVPTVTLQSVPDRPSDTRSVALQLFSGPTASGTGLLAMPQSVSVTSSASGAGTASLLPGTVYAPAGTYTWQATPASGDAFASGTAAAVVPASPPTPSAAAVTSVITLVYSKSVLQVKVTRSVVTPADPADPGSVETTSIDPQPGATVVITAGLATAETKTITSVPTTDVDGLTKVYFDIPTGAAHVTGSWSSTGPTQNFGGVVVPDPTIATSTTAILFTVLLVAVP
ncbi:hypothetical protein EH165_07520 [Nakamurella antarctica]|uniref:Uncharacterized protein n=1 Tax=Nakamurella antarctica TaxID=1902245 RepID=A0A3G8ZL22_9ACTN|nr:hypothetical protein [Nakamurella antarctica]AZI58012.1 hypothetical protein EH165_07520 [Nakamurella antarctica]